MIDLIPWLKEFQQTYVWRNFIYWHKWWLHISLYILCLLQEGLHTFGVHVLGSVWWV